MEIANLANTPIEFTLSEKKYKIVRLSMLDVFGIFEADVKEEYISDIVAMARHIPDVKERIEFQKQAARDIPRGKTMEEQVRLKMDSVEGGIKILHIALNKCQEVPIDEVKEVLSNEKNAAAIQAVMAFLFGDDTAKEEEKLPPGAQKIEVTDAEKKT